MTNDSASVAKSQRAADAQAYTRDIAQRQASRELIFGIVGHVGSGTSTVARNLKTFLETEPPPDRRHQCVIIKARDVIQEWAKLHGQSPPAEETPLLSYRPRIKMTHGINMLCLDR